jgi:hypothetical protein
MAEVMPNGGAGAPVMTFEINAWNGYLELGPLRLPNWLVVISALGVALLGYLRASSAWSAPPLIRIGVAAYGVAHTGLLVVILGGVGAASWGIGSLVTLASCAALLVMVVRDRHDFEPVASTVMGTGGRTTLRSGPPERSSPGRPDPYPAPSAMPGGSMDLNRTRQPMPGGSMELGQARRPMPGGMTDLDQTRQPMPGGMMDLDQTRRPMPGGSMELDQARQPMPDPDSQVGGATGPPS